MGGKQTSSNFYKDKPLFGLDIGYSSIKAVQIERGGKHASIVGYGVGGFENDVIQNGVIIDHESLAASISELFKKNIVGHITTRRVALSLPATRTFTRTLNLPDLQDTELDQAVNMETEQYIPIPIDQLYMDHSVIGRSDKGVELLAVAVPKKIVDSYLQLVAILGLEPVAFDTSISAASRLFEAQGKHDDVPAVLIDFGSVSTDITIHDKTAIVTGTVPSGGDTFTELIAKQLNVTKEEAYIIKSKYGMGKSKKQTEIVLAMQADMDQLVREIRRMIRYYEERSGSKQKIGQIVTMGGGAHMPGLSEYLTSVLRIPTRMCDPWQSLSLGHLQAPSDIEKSVYVTATGLALIQPKELFT